VPVDDTTRSADAGSSNDEKILKLRARKKTSDNDLAYEFGYADDQMKAWRKKKGSRAMEWCLSVNVKSTKADAVVDDDPFRPAIAVFEDGTEWPIPALTVSDLEARMKSEPVKRAKKKRQRYRTVS
jgi:hypothetical protein